MPCLLPRWVQWMICASVLLTTAGCGKSPKKVPTGTVSGKITLDGEPLKEGCVVHFVPKTVDAELSGGSIDRDGHFVAASGKRLGLPVGDYEVQILPPPADQAQQEEDRKKIMGAVLQAVENKTRNPTLPQFSQESVVPFKYWSETTSKLRVKVEEGDNNVNFNLSSK
jgi:hypothetical protein